MSGSLDFTALLFLGIAVFVFFKLRSVLGRRTDDDEARIERYRSQRSAQPANDSSGKIVTLPRRDRGDEAKPEVAAPAETDTDRTTRMIAFAGGDAAIGNGLADIARADPSFDPAEFMKGAQSAYEMIVMAFAEGNRKLLSELLGSEVLAGFAQAIKTREEARETIEQSFVGIVSANLMEADAKAGVAHVTVKFVSELISATRSATGDVLSGDPKKINRVTDIWVFSRESRARDPNWKLVATQAAA